MRSLPAAVAAMLALAPAAARADEPHSVSATCDHVTSGATVVAGTAQAGDHVRPVATSVTCTLVPDPGGTPVSFTRELPGAFAAVAGVAGAGPWRAVCVSATVYWSDGHTTGPTTPLCTSGGSVTVTP